MFADRKEAGGRLAKALLKYKGTRVVVLTLPRGGVPVGYEIARALECPLDTVVARKIGAPGNPEFAVGAIAPGGIEILDIPREEVAKVIREEEAEMERRIKKYKSGTYVHSLIPDTVIVCDDGIATGKTAMAALASSRAAYPHAKLIFAAPVGAPDSIELLRRYADEVVCLETPPSFGAVGEWYEDFPQVEDKEVVRLLETAKRTKR